MEFALRCAHFKNKNTKFRSRWEDVTCFPTGEKKKKNLYITTYATYENFQEGQDAEISFSNSFPLLMRKDVFLSK